LRGHGLRYGAGEHGDRCGDRATVRQALRSDGRIAASGSVLQSVVADILREHFFRKKPPKTAGREQFGREFVRLFLRRCGRVAKADVVATATALTARSIADAIQRFVVKRPGSYREFVVSGGGANNPTLLAMLANELKALDFRFVFRMSLDCRRRRKRLRRLPCWLTRLGTVSLPMCLRLRERSGRRCWGRSRMFDLAAGLRRSAANAPTRASGPTRACRPAASGVCFCWLGPLIAPVLLVQARSQYAGDDY